MSLTPNQLTSYNQLITIIPSYPIIILQGDAGTGKHTIFSHFLSQFHPIVHEFNLLELIPLISKNLSSQYILTHITDAIASLKTCNEDQYGILYIRDFSYITDVLNDCYAQQRYLLNYILKYIVYDLPSNIKIIISTKNPVLPDFHHWTINVINTIEDIMVLPQFLSTSPEFQQVILKSFKNYNIGRLLFSLKYDNQQIDKFMIAWNKFTPTNLDPQFDVPPCQTETDLIGMDSIFDNIKMAVVNPIKLGIVGLNIKKGILLCGPPGTGKTSIGRWLAHNINGKFYLIGAEIGNSILEKFEYCLRKAGENGPAVVFVDDCDSIFTRDDVYRGFLTLLDGVDSKKRHNVCVILTCMNYKTIPISLLRGGRIELVLKTKLPSIESIIKIMQYNLHTIQETINRYNIILGAQVKNELQSFNFELWAREFLGWNCADINRCFDDLCREIIYCNNYQIETILQRHINIIKEQYALCGNYHDNGKLEYYV